MKKDRHQGFKIVARLADLNVGETSFYKLLASISHGFTVDWIGYFYTVYQFPMRIAHLSIIALIPKDWAQSEISRIKVRSDAGEWDHLIKKLFEIALAKVASFAEFLVFVSARSN